MGVIGTFTGRPAACRLHGPLTPTWFSRGRPHCLRRIWACRAQRAADCGWTGVSLSPLPVIAAPGAARRSQRAVGRSLPGQVMARPLKWLMLIAMTMGMCLMNGLFGCLAAPHGSRLRRGEGCPSTIYLTKSHFCSPCLCRIYKMFTIWPSSEGKRPRQYVRLILYLIDTVSCGIIILNWADMRYA